MLKIVLKNLCSLSTKIEICDDLKKDANNNRLLEIRKRIVLHKLFHKCLQSDSRYSTMWLPLTLNGVVDSVHSWYFLLQ